MKRDVLDYTTDGLILINPIGNIEVINYTAKKILGLTGEYTKEHPRGKINDGDIIIFCTNRLGEDDGVIQDTFKKIGLEDEVIFHKPYAIVGVMGGKIKPYVFSITDRDNFQEKTTYLDIPIEIILDFKNHRTLIKVVGYEFPLDYIYAIGNIVILDSHTKELKFFQSRGYTIREENIDDIFKGKEFLAKSPGNESFDITGYNITEIIKNDSIRAYISKSMSEDKGENHFNMIHNVPVLISHYNFEKNSQLFKLFRLVDLSTFYKTIQEQSNALKEFHDLQNIKRPETNPLKGFIGTSSAIQKIHDQALKAANTVSTVLLMGESGTGKSQLAQLIHYRSGRKEQPFIHVNCASLPSSIIESELFGYEPGAFTGAIKSGKKGLFELANNGTIFLDEIGELSMSLQTKLLKVLQEQSFYRVGGETEIKVNIRVIAATNQNLKKMVHEGTFRQDLYYRLFVVPIYIPPLRERREDIEELIWFLLPRVCSKMNVDMRYLCQDALMKLKNYDYPGNIRELENILERAMNLCEGIIIHSDDINFNPNVNDTKENHVENMDLKSQLKQHERKILEDTLNICDGDNKKAMELLKIKKSSFYEKIKEHGINT